MSELQKQIPEGYPVDTFVMGLAEARIAELEAENKRLWTDDQRHMKECWFAAKDCPLDPRCRETGGCYQGHSGRSETCEVVIASDMIGGLRDRKEAAEAEAAALRELVRAVWPDVIHGNNDTVEDWQSRAESLLTTQGVTQ